MDGVVISSPIITRKRSGSTRVRSMDCYESKKHPDLASRSLSANCVASPNLMHRLQFEEIRDDIQHPLSSLRSCSEYNRLVLEGDNIVSDGNELKKDRVSFFSRLAFWRKKKRSKVSESTTSSERTSRSISVGSVSNRGSSRILRNDIAFTSLPTTTCKPFTVADDPLPLAANQPANVRASRCSRTSVDSTATSLSCVKPSADRVRRHPLSVMNETFTMLDALFGLHENSVDMEIELKDLHASMFIPPRGLRSIPSSHSLHEDYRPSLTGSIPRVASFRAFDRIPSEHGGSFSIGGEEGGGHAIGLAIDSPPNPLHLFNVRDRSTWSPALDFLLSEAVKDFRHHLSSPEDETFYEAIRIQPFSSGSYLRGMLVAGVCSTVFHLFSLVLWPTLSPADLTPPQQVVNTLGYWWLATLAVLHSLQFPLRLHIHLQCFASSRTVDVDTAVNILRTLLLSDIWFVNRAVGWVTDAVAAFGMVCCELYFWMHNVPNDPVRLMLIRVCSSIILSLSIRLAMAILFSFSTYDPAVLAEARRRGLSKWDLEVLPAFVFSKAEEVNNRDCPICLCQFEMGEMLISLPCDNRHSFHGACIRQWLHRQNSCPLCQRHV